MGDLIKLAKVRRTRQQDKSKGVTLCSSGFHKWHVVIDAHFDVKQGQLVTTERCIRCNEQRTFLK